MKLFGSLKELVSAVFRKDSRQITLRPSQSVTYSADVNVDLPPNTSSEVLVGAASSQTLTNKTLGSTNNITGSTATSLTNSGTVAIPAGSYNVVGDSLSQTLTNKTLGSTNNISGATASTLSNGGTVTLPSSGTLATLTGTETLQNKNIVGSNSEIVNSANTKQIRLSPGGAGDVRTTIESTSTIARTIQLPDASTTLVGIDNSQSLTNKNLASSTNTLTGATAASFANSGTVSLPTGTTTLLGNDSAQVVTNKDIDGGTASNTSRITLPAANTATLSGLTRKAGTLVYDSQTGLVNYDNGTSLSALASAGVATNSTAGLVTSYNPTVSSSVYTHTRTGSATSFSITATDGYHVYRVLNNAVGKVTANLPAASSCPGKTIRIYALDANTGDVDIQATNNDRIGTNSTNNTLYRLRFTNSSICLTSDGNSQWLVHGIAANYITLTGQINGANPLVSTTVYKNNITRLYPGTYTVQAGGNFGVNTSDPATQYRIFTGISIVNATTLTNNYYTGSSRAWQDTSVKTNIADTIQVTDPAGQDIYVWNQLAYMSGTVGTITAGSWSLTFTQIG